MASKNIYTSGGGDFILFVLAKKEKSRNDNDKKFDRLQKIDLNC